MRRGSKGFTLIEAVVTSMLVAIGVAGTLSGIASMSKAQSRIQEQDRMQRLARSKYDEIIGIGIDNSDTKGNFADAGHENWRWTMETGTTTVQDLTSLKVTVSATDPQDSTQVAVEGLVFEPQPPTQAATP